MAADAPEPRLGDNALAGSRIGLSVSESRDLGRLGLREAHLQLALGEVARAVITTGGTLVYGGHLQPSGYTVFLASELDRYGRSDRPLHLVLSWPEHRRLRLSDLAEHRRSLGLKGSFTYLDATGAEIDPGVGRGEEPVPVEDDTVDDSLTSLRTFMTSVTDARLLLGGKESDFEGRMPGVIEEAMLAVEARQPLFLAGGLGGATASMAQLACDQRERWPPRDPTRDDIDPRATAAIELFGRTITESGWSVTRNGLSHQENLRLATSDRPSEIASLVAVGLGRTFGGRRI